MNPDHPRKNGEHGTDQISVISASGSPPQKRGTQACAPSFLEAHRITPAKTGNTFELKGHHVVSSDHPRKNGEHGMPLLEMPDGRGSPPQKRGTPLATCSRCIVRRITPAKTGNTVLGRRRSLRSPDHPRKNGEHRLNEEFMSGHSGSPPQKRGTLQIPVLASRLGGSPPQKRGTPVFPWLFLGLLRITPAKTGNTSAGSLWSS